MPETKETRETRLAQALRANLQRRKARDRAVAGGDPLPETPPSAPA